MRKALLAFFLVIFAIGAVYSGYRVYDILREYRAGEDLYSGAQQHILFPAAESILTVGKEAVPENIPPEAAKPKLLFPEVDFAGLLQVSEDVVGWVYIDGTNINYPIVQGEDNRYYVSALMDGTENKAGSIFMDYMNNADFSDMHTILYGHNMKNGTMFHDIVYYQEQEFFEQHPVGLIMTPEKNYYFDVVSAYVASLADPAIDSCYAGSANGAVVGHTAQVTVKGYGGDVEIVVGVDADGVITGLNVGGANFSETAGLGAKAKEPAFTEQFKGLTSPLVLKDNVDSITGASITSGAVVGGVNTALDYIASIK